MQDIASPEIHLWHYIESVARSLYESSGFSEIRTPVLESTHLFKRGVGETTDIVEKEMYTFEDRNGDSLSLRPEGTASVVRAMVENNWIRENPMLKLYYFGPMFRHERPQKGRFRQHYQFGLETFGVEGPKADVEIIATQSALFSQLGLKNVNLKLSSIGCDTCRPAYREKLVSLLKPQADKLCEDCQRRLDKNPLRILDCKVESCKAIAKELPTMLDSLCGECVEHFDGVKEGLESVKVDFEIDPMVVRGLDYYNRTSFEFVSGDLGSQSTVCGGGRYDKLVSLLGGAEVPAVGMGMGLERLALLLQDKLSEAQPKPDLYLIGADETGGDYLYPLAHSLRQKGVWVEMDLNSRPMKAQLKRANKLSARYSLIIGEKELSDQKVVLKNMQEHSQEDLSLDKLEAQLLKILGYAVR